MTLVRHRLVFIKFNTPFIQTESCTGSHETSPNTQVYTEETHVVENHAVINSVNVIQGQTKLKTYTQQWATNTKYDSDLSC